MRGNYISKVELSNFIARLSLLLSEVEMLPRTKDKLTSEVVDILEETLRIKIEAY